MWDSAASITSAAPSMTLLASPIARPISTTREGHGVGYLSHSGRLSVMAFIVSWQWN
jgi:hypothetical protein